MQLLLLVKNICYLFDISLNLISFNLSDQNKQSFRYYI